MLRQILKEDSINSRRLAYSVIVPAYNEAEYLGATLSNLLLAMKSASWQGEIIVVDNNSTDNTKTIALEHGARVVHEPLRQIARARNIGAQAAAGEYLIFLDADTIISPQLLLKSLTLLTGSPCCGGGTLLNYDAKLPFLAGRLVGCWNWLSKTCKLAAGSFIFCLARGFKEIGGFDERIFAGEEVRFSRKLRAWGKKHDRYFTIISDQSVITSGRKFQWYSSLRIALLLMLFTVFPYGLRYRSLCSFWYRRPIR